MRVTVIGLGTVCLIELEAGYEKLSQGNHQGSNRCGSLMLISASIVRAGTSINTYKIWRNVLLFAAYYIHVIFAIVAPNFDAPNASSEDDPVGNSIGTFTVKEKKM